MLHPRLRLNGKVSTAQLRARIQKYCTLTETDVIAVLDALSHAMGEELAEGRQVHLDGIGFFRPNLVSTEPVTEKTKRKNTKVRLKGIVYRPDRLLMDEVGKVKVQRTRFSFHSSKLTDEEIDALLTEFFTTHDFVQRKSFQTIYSPSFDGGDTKFRGPLRSRPAAAPAAASRSERGCRARSAAPAAQCSAERSARWAGQWWSSQAHSSGTS